MSADRGAPERAARALGPLARAAREAGDGSAVEARDREQKEKLLTALAQRAAFGKEGAGQGARRRTVVAGAVAALALAAAILLWVLPRSPLGYTVDGVTVAEGGYVAPSDREAVIRFSDGTRVRLAPQARGRVAEVDAHGARLLLESGGAHVEVVPGRGGRWSVEAGPFVVEVTGTEFDVAWSASEQVLDLRMQHGAVRVRGPLASGVELVAGQRLLADVARGKVSLGDATETASAPPAAAPSGEAPPDPRADREPIAPAPTAPARAEPKPQSWAARVAGGDFAGVVSEAEGKGVEAVLDSAPLADLVALADAARYVGRGDLARRALLAQRARYAGSNEARAAAFLLGRMADDRGATGEAISLYDRYLQEAPGGSFAAEALGRKMVAVQKSAGREAARPIAEEYLRRFPAGAYATAAEQLARP